MAFAPAKTFVQRLSKAPECGALQTLREFRCGSSAPGPCVKVPVAAGPRLGLITDYWSLITGRQMAIRILPDNATP
jgi:hypothetical protein